LVLPKYTVPSMVIWTIVDKVCGNVEKDNIIMGNRQHCLENADTDPIMKIAVSSDNDIGEIYALGLYCWGRGGGTSS